MAPHDRGATDYCRGRPVSAQGKLRDTLFALWFILVLIKLSAFLWVGIDLQLIHHLWLLPAAAVGHVIGLYAHDRLLHSESNLFFRVLGGVLLTVSAVGLFSVWG